ncbi:dehydratase family protein 2 [Hysterangium stoloniferum]|nr:dehydratase family protein 2 [Hysterangium stoloniferum]
MPSSQRVQTTAIEHENARPAAAAGDRAGLRAGLTSYGDEEFALFLRKAFIKGAGYTDDALDRPIIGIVDTSSGYNPCHGNMSSLIEAVKRGVLLCGALPITFPIISLHESFAYPTSMYLRNLMSMDAEEMIRAQPMDAVVLVGGCDKTVPAELMGAISADTPAIQLVAGPMLTGSHAGVRVGACTDCRKYWASYRAGDVDIEELGRVNNELVPGPGTCGVMGTASTMACISEALGMSPLGSSTPPAVSSARLRVGEQTGKLAVALAKSRITPAQILTKKSFENAITVLHALGGSTNAIVHLLAIAGRVPGVDLRLDDIDRIGRKTPLLLDLKPSGYNYMEDFDNAGGMPVLLRHLRGLLHLDAPTVTGKTLGDELDAYPPSHKQLIIRDISQPIFPASALAVLRGNLAPNGAVIKQSAATKTLLRHTGPAVVFSSPADLAKRIDSDDLDATPDSVLVLQNIGSVGAPGMPEAGLIPIPKKLARNGVKDMVRISDGRMSGTAAGTVVLHVSPEAAAGGPLAVVCSGDSITIDVEARSLSLDIESDELDARLKAWKPIAEGSFSPKRGYASLFKRSVLGAEHGVDFDFLRAEGAISRF